MRIAITSTGPSLEDAPDERFGRARNILIADTETGMIRSIDNHENVNAAQGAGIQAAQIVADQKADWVLTGHVGPKAFKALAAVGIQVALGVENASTCAEALERFRQGAFEAVGESDVASHW